MNNGNTPSSKQTHLRLAPISVIAQMPEYKECFTVSSLRHLVFQAEDRVTSKGEAISGVGLGSAIIRIGRKVLIDLDVFDQWIELHRGKGTL